MFHFIRKKIVVDCFTDLPWVAENHPIRPSVKHTPSWWKSLPGSISFANPDLSFMHQQSTMKKCSGFLDLYRSAWTLPLWADYSIKTNEQGEYEFLVPQEYLKRTVTYHPAYQYGNHFQNFMHLKLQSPWLLFEKRGVKFGFMPNTWELLETFPNVQVMPGVVNFKTNAVTHINMFLPKQPAFYAFTAGLPIIQLIPLTEYNVEFRVQCVTTAEYQHLEKRTVLHATSFKSQNLTNSES